MAKIVDKYIDYVKTKYAHEPEFIQTVDEVLNSIEPVMQAHPEYEKSGLLWRLIEPERTISFRVPWVDDNGEVHVNTGYRVEFNSALGPYKGGLRFAPNVYSGILKFLGFEQIFKNSLTGLPIGGGKGGADFDPNGKSDAEIMRFCQAFINELYRYLGPNVDVPAGDLGVGGREIGFMMGQYKKLTRQYDGTWTGKGTENGGLAGRTEATGYGIVFYAREMLKHFGEELKGKTVVISGFGNVAWGTAQKLDEMGAKVIAFSGPDGYILDEDGVTGEKVDYFLELRSSGKNICSPYAEKFPNAKFVAGKKPWEVKADLYIPCAMQNDIHLEDAKNMVANGCKYLCEGANMPTTEDAIAYLQEHDVVIGPSKAANAGGVACSCLEMSQNAEHILFSKEDVYVQLEGIMVNIFKLCADACEKYNLGFDLIAGANIAGFERVAKAMMLQGIV
ncbi:glutamate dehydrogenase (NADP+) [Eubacterium pyruvativorans]|jgi:glutamate dehydrogenase (NADP+)|uniref:Glutamate dehydrogenase n=1 Tax=Eubacterium pyruvativorans TaxID=155865 RepID=A0A1I7GDA9_9FIRM|nr:NADP-specific glutamate dehydrogenase [Eubacterium pyruvativorans]MCI5747337.1 NADP-specific glutamate dehydrogenase [Eubacterium pyruvativorans]MDD6708259.1 NADP-specific glutamate dehydrogenase [Eubacterium pyruvativorans]MDD7685375.1 NADP-specific glutamate dehydrogenase [Eubacterium pyruvativorans]MDY4049104.1 NADP-specific glutamate dehydrogenase [Eubacterium pyruvativorans]SDF01358.1 glutamate dehydrogenase (NADP+) [Eubacterium pyruvativorans]